jgi:hypothetical protein
MGSRTNPNETERYLLGRAVGAVVIEDLSPHLACPKTKRCPAGHTPLDEVSPINPVRHLIVLQSLGSK